MRVSRDRGHRPHDSDGCGARSGRFTRRPVQRDLGALFGELDPGGWLAELADAFDHSVPERVQEVVVVKRIVVEEKDPLGLRAVGEDERVG